MDHLSRQLLSMLRTQPGVLVSVVSTKGSVPRDVGTWMAVFADSTLATVGGGRLELDAVRPCQAACWAVRYPIPRCCTAWAPAWASAAAARWYWVSSAWARPTPRVWRSSLAARLQPVALFGAGHVGLALVRVLERPAGASALD